VATDQWWQRPGARAILAALGVVLLLHVVGFIALTVMQRGQGETVLAGVHVAGEAVEGASRDELVSVVDGIAQQHLDEPVHVTASEAERQADRGEVGVTADTERTIDRAWQRGRRGPYRSLWDHLRARTGTTIDVDVAFEHERAVLEAWAREAADELSRSRQDGAIEFVTGDDEVTVEVTEPREGRQVDADDLADAVEAALDEPGAVQVEAPTDVEDPAITEADLDAIRVEAERAVSAPVVLVNPSAGDDLELSPVALTGILAVEADPDAPEGERLTITTSGQRLLDHLGDEGISRFDEAPVDAELTVNGTEVDVIDGEPGFAMDPEATAERIRELALHEEGEPDAPREGELAGDVTQPDVTREDLEDHGIEEEVSSFTTELTPGQPRNQNIQRGAELLDGAIIAPGETFSLNGHVGPRTRERGFQENGYIDDGELVSVVGGGSSQLGTTFFNAAWFAGIQIPDFQPHSFYFSRYPMGREATLSYGTIDVVVENDSPHHILVSATSSESSVTVRFFSTPWAEVETWTGEPRNRVQGAVRDGFTVDFGRTITYPDGSTRSEEHTHRYNPED
jgi:vancomycin resistance protein YoaR